MAGGTNAGRTTRLLTAQELADELGVPLKTVYVWNAKGTGPARVKIGKHVRYRRADLESWLATQVVPGGGAA